MSHAEPFRIRSVETIRLISAAERKASLERAGYNPFKLPAKDVFIDLLTDSGTGSMSDNQWAAMHCADESYAGSASFFRLRDTIREITGFEELIPTHQGRAAERVFCDVMLQKGDVVVSNGLFDTTRANVERVGAIGIDIPTPTALDPGHPDLLKGAIDLKALDGVLAKGGVKLCILTITNNTFGGHPMPLENFQEAVKRCRAKKVPVFIDGARYAENAGMLIRRDPSCKGRTPRDLCAEFFKLADGMMMSAKKNAIVHIGGFIALHDAVLASKLRENLIVTEGFETYGGLAGRDLDAMAIGLKEALDPAALDQRLGQVERFHKKLVDAGVPVMLPAGGHGVYIDAAKLLPHLPAEQLPGHAVAVELYLEGGIRTCEIGTLMFPPGSRPEGSPELTRLAIPWRTYTDNHFDHIVETFQKILARREKVRGYRIVEAPAALRHFRAVLAPV